MKNILKITLVLLVLLLGATTVKATTTSEFLNHITTVQSIGGENVVLVDEEQKVQVERYILKNNLSEETLSYIQQKYDEGVKVLQDAGTADYKKLNQNEKDKLIAIADETSSKTGIKYKINSNETVTIYNLDGTAFTTTTDKIKQTGSSNYIYVVPVVAIIAVAIVVISRRVFANAK